LIAHFEGKLKVADRQAFDFAGALSIADAAARQTKWRLIVVKGMARLRAL
jgi:hypothetical protein